MVRKLHDVLHPEPTAAPTVFHQNLGQQASRYHLRKQVSLSVLFLGLCAVLAVAFGAYHYPLIHQTQDVLRQLGELLQ